MRDWFGEPVGVEARLNPIHALERGEMTVPDFEKRHIVETTRKGEKRIKQGFKTCQFLTEQPLTLLDAIDASGGFYRNDVAVSARSRMNIPFFLPSTDLDARFVADAKAAGLLALKGHKVVGGIRASLYNAMPLAGAEALVAFMADFQQRHG